MKNRLVKLLKMGHVLDWAEDRAGVYSLRYVNKFPKFRRAPRIAPATSSPGAVAASNPEPSLFESAKTQPVEAASPSVPVPPSPPNNSAPPAVSPSAAAPEPTASVAPAPLANRGAFIKLKGVLAACVAFVPKICARCRAKFFPPATDPRTHAQAELALENVKVICNDLSDADLVVVAVQAKPEDPCAAKTAGGGELAESAWPHASARWIKLKQKPEEPRTAVAPSRLPLRPESLAPRSNLAQVQKQSPC